MKIRKTPTAILLFCGFSSRMYNIVFYVAIAVHLHPTVPSASLKLNGFLGLQLVVVTSFCFSCYCNTTFFVVFLKWNTHTSNKIIYASYMLLSCCTYIHVWWQHITYFPMFYLWLVYVATNSNCNCCNRSRKIT